MQVEVKLIFSSPAEAAAFLAADPVDIRFAVAKPATVAALTSPSVTDEFPEPGMEAPGKPSAAPTARSPRTAAAGPSTSAPSPAAPETAPTATPVDAPAPSAGAPADAPAFEYATLQKAVNARVAKFGKDALLAVAKKHGAATFKDLPASAWAAAHADVIALGE